MRSRSTTPLVFASSVGLGLLNLLPHVVLFIIILIRGLTVMQTDYP